jgi:hypothetical protein
MSPSHIKCKKHRALAKSNYNMYDHIFRCIYLFFKRYEAGLSSQTDSSRAQETVMIMSFWGLMNLMSLWPKVIVGTAIVAPMILLLIGNGLIFLLGSRYKKIASKKSQHENVYTSVAIVYISGTVIWFAATR